MWEHDWASKEPPTAVSSGPSRERTAPGRVAPLFWEEHCLECAPPTCYTQCALYVPRADGLCARVDGGIRRHPAGGAEVRFRRWGKLVSEVPEGLVPAWVVAVLQVLDRVASALVRAVASVMPRRAARRVLSAYEWRRRRLFRRAGRRPSGDVVLVGQIWNLGDDAMDLVVEREVAGLTLARESWTLRPGFNECELTMSTSDLRWGEPGSRVSVEPAGGTAAHLVFEALDLVERAPASSGSAPAVKCVAWDLDNTLWVGTLAESDADDLALADGIEGVVRELDRRGILQTIVSRNDAEPALAVLERMGLRELFVEPQISWGPKSDALRAAAAALNIGIDTFLFVDDSAFERAEVERALPTVRTVDAADVPSLLDRGDLTAVSTSEGRDRRRRYQEESRRKAALADAGSDYEAFILSCEIRGEVFEPITDDDAERCVELIQRSNQLNLSGRRLTREDFDRARADGLQWFALRAEDRFGPYGIIGILSVDEVGADGAVVIRDLCISCRAANRMLERAWVSWLAARHPDATRLVADLVPTERNGVLQDALIAAGFRRGEGSDRLELPLPAVIPGAELVTLVDLVDTNTPS